MGLPAVFGESFLDGFSMAGFLSRLRRPEEATQLLAPDPLQTPPGLHLTFEVESAHPGGVRVDGNLGSVPEQALHAMMDMLKKEDEQRRKSRTLSEKALHGASH